MSADLNISDMKKYALDAKAISGKATPGPWFDSRSKKSIKVTFESKAFNRGDFCIAKYPTRTNQSLVSHSEWEANALLIARSITDLPTLADMVLSLIEQNEKLEQQLKKFKGEK